MIIERKSFGRKPENQFRRGKMLDAHVGNRDAVAEIAVAFMLVRFLRPEAAGKISKRRPYAKLIDRLREGSAEPKNDFSRIQAFGDHE